MSIKAYDLVPVINKLDHFKTGQIESFCYSNTILCIGTSDGQLFRFSINRSNYQGENTGFNSTLIDSKTLNYRKPINQITVIPELKKIIYLSDGSLSSINFDDLEPCASNQIRIKNVTTYCFNKKYKDVTNPFGIKKSLLSLCIKGKTIQLYFCDEKSMNITLYKEITLPELCLQIESNKNHLCIATESCYLIVDIKNSSVQKLFSYEIENFKPFIVNHLEGEFLLNCEGNLGIFAAPDGQSNKPPLTWCSNCHSFQISHPYVLCSNNETIQVYNLLDSKLKQTINFSHVRSFEYINEEKFFIITTPVQMYFINAVSTANQIEQLLALKYVDEAIQLFESLFDNKNSVEHEEKFKSIKTKAGFIELTSNRNFAKAEGLFIEANLDFSEIATLIPDFKILPENTSEFSSYIKSLQDSIKDAGDEKEFVEKLKLLLINCMQNTKNSKTEEFIAVLFELFAQCLPEKLADQDFFIQLPLKFCLHNTKILCNYNRHHSIAIIYHLLNMNEDAIKIWKDLCDEVLSDEYFPGFDYVVKQLSTLKDHQLLLSYIDWAMNIDQEKAVEIFTKRPTNELASERLRPDVIIERLVNYKEALVIFLEYLVYNKNIMKEKYTTQLIGVYLENVIGMIKQKNETRTSEWTSDLDKARKKLQNLLQSSTNYRVQLILGRIKEFEKYLQKECAILYGKIEEHEKALKILVYTLQDYQAATEYCLKNSKDSIKSRKHLFNILFTIYMNPTYNERDKLLKPTLELLNSHLIPHFDIPKLIEIMPNNWSVKISSNFLLNVLQKNLAVKNNVSVRKNLASNLKIDLKSVTYDLRKEQLYIDDDSECYKCRKPFESSIFIRHPNGKLSHIMCKNDSIKF